MVFLHHSQLRQVVSLRPPPGLEPEGFKPGSPVAAIYAYPLGNMDKQGRYAGWTMVYIDVPYIYIYINECVYTLWFHQTLAVENPGTE